MNVQIVIENINYDRRPKAQNYHCTGTPNILTITHETCITIFLNVSQIQGYCKLGKQ